MKAVLGNHLLAESDDVVECAGYHYFPRAAVRMEWLETAPRTEDDRECLHGVQFYDVVIEGGRHARAAWSYEDPRPGCSRSPDASASGRGRGALSGRRGWVAAAQGRPEPELARAARVGGGSGRRRQR